MRWLRWVLGIVACVVGLLSLAPLALYLHCVRFANTELAPAEAEQFPRAALELMASDCGCDVIEPMTALNPYTYFSRGIEGDCSERISSRAARLMVPRNIWQLRYTATWISATIWVSRHWTTEEALATGLARAHFSPDSPGLEAAAQLYFARRSNDLTREEIAQLIATSRSLTRFNPWCEPTRNRARANHLLGRDEDSPIESRLAPAPAGYCAR
ncbi:MAG: transglycosylase domain-containing protein [Deltaproteobacteria bacterium]|nr:transglycosylase domain-containing protein [Deltaproteobacteria bacterium]